MDREQFKRWKKIKAALFSTAPPKDPESFVSRVMARLDETPVPARPHIQRVPVRIFAPLVGVAAMLLMAIVPVSGPSADWMVGSDRMSQLAFSGEAPQNDDMLEFVLVRS